MDFGFKLRFPFATLFLALLICGLYFALSGGLLYLGDGQVSALALSTNAPAVALFTHLFVHVGILHLVGNMVPLVVFGAVAESLVGPVGLLVVFLVAGVVSSVVFAFANPGYSIVGASAGISGIIGVVAISRPKAAIALLLALPFVMYLVVFPVANAAVSFQESSIAAAQAQFVESAVSLNESNHSVAAVAAASAAEQAGSSLMVVENGQQREAATPSDLFVHVLGAVIGMGFVVFFWRGLLARGVVEFEELGGLLGGFLPKRPKRAS